MEGSVDEVTLIRDRDTGKKEDWDMDAILKVHGR